MNKYYGVFDGSGKPIAFYCDELHGDKIPTEAVEISHNDWLEFINNSGLRRWDGKKVVEYTPPPPPPSYSPLTARQLRLGLVSNGISLSQVEEAIDAIEDQKDKEVAQIEWEYASTFDRYHPLIEQVGGALELTSEQIDTMWLEALNM